MAATFRFGRYPGLVPAALVMILLGPAVGQTRLVPGPEAEVLATAPAAVADPADLARRVDRLEAVVRRLNGEVEALRRELGIEPTAEVSERLPIAPSPTPAALPEIRAARTTLPAGEPRHAAPAERALAEGPPTSLLPLPQGLVAVAPAQTGAMARPRVEPEPQPRQALEQALRGAQPGHGAEVEAAALSAPVDDPAGAEYAAAYAHLLAGDMGAAGAAFDAFLKDHPKHELSGNAQYWLAETRFARADYAGAARAFLAGYTAYRSSPKAPDSLLRLGVTLEQLGRHDEACASFAEVAKRFPDAGRSIHQRAATEAADAGC